MLTALSFPPRTPPPRLHPPPPPPPPPPPLTPVATITCEPPRPRTRTTRPAAACCFPPAPQRNQGSAPTCAPRPRPLRPPRHCCALSAHRVTAAPSPPTASLLRPLRPPRHCCSRRYDVEASPAASVLSSASTAFGGRGSSVPHAAGSRQVLMPLPRAPPPIPCRQQLCQSSSSVLGRDHKQRWTQEEAQRYASDRERESDRTWCASA
jgi:hypothetical protein